MVNTILLQSTSIAYKTLVQFFLKEWKKTDYKTHKFANTNLEVLNLQHKLHVDLNLAEVVHS